MAGPRRPPCRRWDPVRWNVLLQRAMGWGNTRTWWLTDIYHPCSLFLQPCLSKLSQHSSSQCLSGIKAVLQVAELKCKKADSEVFVMQRKASCNFQENFDEALQPSTISSVLATLMTSLLLSISSSSQGQRLHFASAPDAVLSANPPSRWGAEGQRSSHLASWWIIVMNGNHLEDKSGSCSLWNEAAGCTTQAKATGKGRLSPQLALRHRSALSFLPVPHLPWHSKPSDLQLSLTLWLCSFLRYLRSSDYFPFQTLSEGGDCAWSRNSLNQNRTQTS